MFQLCAFLSSVLNSLNIVHSDCVCVVCYRWSACDKSITNFVQDWMEPIACKFKLDHVVGKQCELIRILMCIDIMELHVTMAGISYLY